MTRAFAATLLALACLAPGCITFYGDAGVRVQVIVSEDLGTTVLERENVTVPEGSTVMDALREVAPVETRYGGGFVHAIDGRESRFPDERIDWFYHVDTRLANVGAASNQVENGDLVLWDYRPWNRTMTLEHVLTGLDAWPATLPENPSPTPAAWRETATDPTRSAHLYARVANETLVLLDARGHAQSRLEAPWLLVHAVDGPGEAPAFLVRASGPAGLDLADRIQGTPPRGVGAALTPNATLGVPAG